MDAREHAIANFTDDVDPQPTEVDSALFRVLFGSAHRMGVEILARIDGKESLVELVVLQALAGPRPPVLIGEVASVLGCSRQAAVQTLGRLERRGLIRRNADLYDGRVKTIVITEAGRTVWNADRGPICAVIRKGTASITAEKEALVRLLDSVERDANHARVMRAWEGRRAKRAKRVHVR